MTKKIFIIAGESSGDALGARLMQALRSQSSRPLEFEGIGGPLMQAQGLKSLLPMQEICVIGIWEVASHLPRLLKLIHGLVEEIESRAPDLLLTIDLPDFNFQVGARLKKRGHFKGRHVHYVAPTVWAWRPGRAKKIAAFLDGLICLYPFEPAYFKAVGLKAVFAGHPMVEEHQATDGAQAFRTEYSIPPDAPLLGLFFGSRMSEIKSLSPVFLQSLEFLLEQCPDLHVVAPTLPHLEYDVLQSLSGRVYPAFVITDPRKKAAAFSAMNFALAASGTVGLELAYAGVPHVIAYKVHPMTWLAVRTMVKVKYAHLANILLDAPVVPECLQGSCKPLNIAEGLLKLLRIPGVRAAQVQSFAALRHKLGADEATKPSARAAAFVLKFLEK